MFRGVASPRAADPRLLFDFSRMDHGPLDGAIESDRADGLGSVGLDTVETALRQRVQRLHDLIADRLGATTRIVAVASDAPSVEDERTWIVSESDLALLLPSLPTLPSTAAEAPPFVMLLVGDVPRAESLVRREQLWAVAFDEASDLDVETLGPWLELLGDRTKPALLDLRSPPVESSWGGDGVDESLFDLLERDGRVTVLVDATGTVCHKTREAHPARCLSVGRVECEDLIRWVGFALHGERALIVIGAEASRRLGDELANVARLPIPLDVVVVTHAADEVSIPRIAADVVDSSRLDERLATAPDRPRFTAAIRPRETPGPRPKGGDVLVELGFTAASLQSEHESVLAQPLGEDVEQWFERYRSVGERTRYLWQWCSRGAELTALPSLAPAFREHVRDTKVLAIFLDVLLDDAIDVHRDPCLLAEVLHVVQDLELPATADRTSAVREYLDVTLEFAAAYEQRVRTYPRFHEFEQQLRFDNEQYFNAMRYGSLVSENLELLNVLEHELYLPGGMHMMGFATLDLMCSPEFGRPDLGRLREAIWFAQCMGRAGNVLGTWRREIAQRDFTSGIFARAVREGDITIEELLHRSPAEIESRIESCGHEAWFRSRWQHHRECFSRTIGTIGSVDLRGLIDGQDRFCRMHLAGRGLI